MATIGVISERELVSCEVCCAFLVAEKRGIVKCDGHEQLCV